MNKVNSNQYVYYCIVLFNILSYITSGFLVSLGMLLSSLFIVFVSFVLILVTAVVMSVDTDKMLVKENQKAAAETINKVRASFNAPFESVKHAFVSYFNVALCGFICYTTSMFYAGTFWGSIVLLFAVAWPAIVTAVSIFRTFGEKKANGS